MLEYVNITDAPFWSNLDFDGEVDDEMLLIEIYCSVLANTKARPTRETKVETDIYLDDEWDGAEEYINQLENPGPDFVHPNQVKMNKVFADFDALSIKYGEEHFRNFLQDFYNNYPTPAEYSNPIQYLISLNPEFHEHVKWTMVSDLLSLTHEYLIREE
jgi:hypothetical protein